MASRPSDPFNMLLLDHDPDLAWWRGAARLLDPAAAGAAERVADEPVGEEPVGERPHGW